MKIASVGFWHLHGKDYAEAAALNPDTELVAVWDPDQERGIAAAAQFHLTFMPELEGILNDEKIEGVIVCTATVDHLDIVTRCLRAGKHVFVEKVLGTTREQAVELVKTARECGVALVVSLWRSDRAYAHQISDLVAAGEVGVVTSARIRDGHPFALPADNHPGGILPPSFWEPSEAAGGIFIDLCHPVYLLAQIMGYPEFVMSAFSSVTSRAVEDNAAILATFPDGAFAVAETTSVSRITPFIIEVHGTEGSILYSEPGIGALVAQASGGPSALSAEPDDRPRLRLRNTRNAAQSWNEIPLRADQPIAFDQWVAHCKAETRADANLNLAIALSGIVEAAYRSAAEHQAVHTP